jgi:hypothetical protein
MHCRNGFEWISPDATVVIQFTLNAIFTSLAFRTQDQLCGSALICPPTGLTDAIIVRGDLEPGVRETRAKAQVVRKSGAGGSEYQH